MIVSAEGLQHQFMDNVNVILSDLMVVAFHIPATMLDCKTNIDGYSR